MSFEDLFIDLDTSISLKNAGIPQVTCFYYSLINNKSEIKNRNEHPIKQALSIRPDWFKDIYSAYTLAELIQYGNSKGLFFYTNIFYKDPRKLSQVLVNLILKNVSSESRG